MATPQERRDNFAMTFNKLLGAAGKTAYNPDQSVYDENNPSLLATYQASNARKKYTSKPKTATDKSKKALSSKLTKEEADAFVKARSEELKSEDKPWWKDALGVVARPLDILNRPAATVVNAANRALEAVEQGEPIWSVGDDAFYGARRGFTGQDKGGYGDLLQTAKRVQEGQGENTGWGNRFARGLANASSLGAQARVSNALDDKFGTQKMDVDLPGFLPTMDLNPGATFDRAVGLAGDIGTDPTTYVGVGLVTKALKGGRAVGEQAVEGVARNAVEESAQALGKNIDLPTAIKNEFVDPTLNKSTSDLLNSADAAEQAVGKTLKAGEEQVISGAVRDAKLINDLETGKITKADFFAQYQKTGSKGGGIKTILQDAKKFKTPTDQVVDDIVKARKLSIEGSTKTLRESIQEAVEGRTKFLINEVHTRSQKGKIVGGVGEDYTDTVANVITEKFRTDSLETVTRSVDQFKKGISTGKGGLSANEIARLSAADPYFKEWIDTFQKINNAKPTSLTQPQVIKAMKAADEAVLKAVEKESGLIANTVKGTLTDQFYNVPTLRMFGNDIVDFPRIGKQLHTLKNATKNSPVGENFRKAFSYTANFPGYTSLISQKVKSLGVRSFEQFRDETIAAAKELSVKERKALTKFLVDGIPPTDPRIYKAWLFVRSKYDEIYGLEVQDGIRDAAKKPMIDNYTYTHVKGGTDFRRFQKERTAALKKNGTLDGYRPDDLQGRGIKIEEDAFKNLLIRQQKSIRKRTTAAFQRDLAAHYGIKSSMTKAEATARNLVRLDPKKIPTWEGLPLKPGEAIYIDHDINEVFKTYTNLTRIQAGDDLAGFVRSMDWVTRKFKTWNTIYFPAYHVRNAIGDMFMGFMDGVGLSDYKRIERAMFQNRTSTSVIHLGGKPVRFDEKVLNAYKDTLQSSSFLNADIGSTMSVKGRTVPAQIRKMSEWREDFGRITHFYRALDDEISARVSKGMDWDKAYEQSLNTAAFRVNKFKFDYDALTAVEKKYVRRGIPFYTYMRKAVPTLVESMALQPRFLGNMNRLQTGLEEEWEDAAVPDWLRELGYMKLPFGNNYGMTDQFLPSATLRSLTENPISKINPLLQVPIEANTGVDSFTGQPLKGEDAWSRLPDVLMNKWRGFGIIDPRDEEQGLLENTEKTGAEKVFNFLGIPIRRFDANEQDQAYTEMRYNLKKALEKATSRIEKKGYTVYLSERSDGISLRVKDKLTDEVIFEGKTLAEVNDFIEGL